MKSIDGIMGFVVGDAFGVPFEFKDRSYFKNNPVTKMIGNGIHNQPIGTWSDDSSLTLCLLESLTMGLEFEDIQKKFILWKNDGYMTAHDEVFDIGYSTTKAIEKMEEGTSLPSQCGGKNKNDNGNGSLMRILPLAYFSHSKSNINVTKLVDCVSSMTHGHIISKIACNLYVKTAMNLLEGSDPYKALYHASYMSNVVYAGVPEIRNFDRIIHNNIEEYDENEILSTGYVVHTLEAALWSWLTTETYKDCILKAVNLGGDTDTICAIAGGLAGIQYGYESIPKEWVENIVKKEIIERLCDDFDRFNTKR